MQLADRTPIDIDRLNVSQLRAHAKKVAVENELMRCQMSVLLRRFAEKQWQQPNEAKFDISRLSSLEQTPELNHVLARRGISEGISSPTLNSMKPLRLPSTGTQLSGDVFSDGRAAHLLVHSLLGSNTILEDGNQDDTEFNEPKDIEVQISSGPLSITFRPAPRECGYALEVESTLAVSADGRMLHAMESGKTLQLPHSTGVELHPNSLAVRPLSRGMVLVSLAGRDIRGKSAKEVQRFLEKAPRPILMRFRHLPVAMLHHECIRLQSRVSCLQLRLESTQEALRLRVEEAREREKTWHKRCTLLASHVRRLARSYREIGQSLIYTRESLQQERRQAEQTHESLRNQLSALRQALAQNAETLGANVSALESWRMNGEESSEQKEEMIVPRSMGHVPRSKPMKRPTPTHKQASSRRLSMIDGTNGHQISQPWTHTTTAAAQQRDAALEALREVRQQAEQYQRKCEELQEILEEKEFDLECANEDIELLEKQIRGQSTWHPETNLNDSIERSTSYMLSTNSHPAQSSNVLNPTLETSLNLLAEADGTAVDSIALLRSYRNARSDNNILRKDKKRLQEERDALAEQLRLLLVEYEQERQRSPAREVHLSETCINVDAANNSIPSKSDVKPVSSGASSNSPKLDQQSQTSSKQEANRETNETAKHQARSRSSTKPESRQADQASVHTPDDGLVDINSSLDPPTSVEPVAEPEFTKEDALVIARAAISEGAEAAMEGWMHKRSRKKGQRRDTRWLRRYFRLSDACLLYYKQPTDAKAVGSVGMAQMLRIEEISKSLSGRPNSFQLHCVDKVFTFSAENESMCKKWMLVLQELIDMWARHGLDILQPDESEAPLVDGGDSDLSD